MESSLHKRKMFFAVVFPQQNCSVPPFSIAIVGVEESANFQSVRVFTESESRIGIAKSCCSDRQSRIGFPICLNARLWCQFGFLDLVFWKGSHVDFPIGYLQSDKVANDICRFGDYVHGVVCT